jgi:hypothetical protein
MNLSEGSRRLLDNALPRRSLPTNVFCRPFLFIFPCLFTGCRLDNFLIDRGPSFNGLPVCGWSDVSRGEWLGYAF